MSEKSPAQELSSGTVHTQGWTVVGPNGPAQIGVRLSDYSPLSTSLVILSTEADAIMLAGRLGLTRAAVRPVGVSIFDGPEATTARAQMRARQARN